MNVFRDLRELSPGGCPPGGCPPGTGRAVTLGTFDGVHRGHQAILRELRAVAGREGLRSVLLTFDPHPREVLLRNGERVGLLTTIDERLRLIAAHGIDECIVLPFTRDLSLMEAGEFYRRILRDAIDARHIVVGENHAFGKGRSGTTDELRNLALAGGVRVSVVPSLLEEGRKLSSTVIRHALRDGDIATARLLLGRPYHLDGIVQRGEGLGRDIGFPTANIRPDSENKLLPKRGVYAVRVSVLSAEWNGIMNIGVRPTVSESGDESVEVHILHFDADIYGSHAGVDIYRRIRDERTFDSVESLCRQLASDRSETEQWFSMQETTISELT